MRFKLRVLENWLSQLNLLLFVLILLLFTYLAALISGLIIDLLNLDVVEWASRDYGNLVELVYYGISAIFIAPLLETFIFQKLPTDLLIEKPIFQKKTYLLILFSAFCFGLLHIYFSPAYAFFAFSVGIVLMWGYVIRYKVGKKPFTSIWLVHLIRNVIAIGYNIYVLYIK